MKSKEERIAELQAEIEKIKAEPDAQSFVLIEVTPDKSATFPNTEKRIAISKNKGMLHEYCISKFRSTPTMDDKPPFRNNDNWFDTWYRIVPSNIEIVVE